MYFITYKNKTDICWYENANLNEKEQREYILYMLPLLE